MPIPTAVKVEGVDSTAIYQPQPERKLDPIELDTETFEQGLDLWLPAKLRATAQVLLELKASAIRRVTTRVPASAKEDGARLR